MTQVTIEILDIQPQAIVDVVDRINVDVDVEDWKETDDGAIIEAQATGNFEREQARHLSKAIWDTNRDYVLVRIATEDNEFEFHELDFDAHNQWGEQQAEAVFDDLEHDADNWAVA